MPRQRMARARLSPSCPWRQPTLLENFHVGKSDVWQVLRPANRICELVENLVGKPELCVEAVISVVHSLSSRFGLD